VIDGVSCVRVWWQTVLRVFDALLYEGSVVLLRIGLAIFKLKERALLATRCVHLPHRTHARVHTAIPHVRTLHSSGGCVRAQGFRRMLECLEDPPSLDPRRRRPLQGSHHHHRRGRGRTMFDLMIGQSGC
jgi:hypothetical protein